MPRAPSTYPAPRRSVRCWPLRLLYIRRRRAFAGLRPSTVGRLTRPLNSLSRITTPAEFCLATTVETPPSCRRGLFRVLAALRQDVHELALRRLQQADQLGQRALNGADDLRAQRFLRRQVGERLQPGRLQHLALDVACL